MKILEDFLKPTQAQLFDYLRKTYKDRATVCKGNYILVKGDAPIMLLAHLDTVHKEPVKDICKTKGGNILMSPQGIGGDDRCGVYAITTVFENAEVKPWLLFTCDEEIGGVGAEKFADMYRKKKLPKALGKLKLLIEIDRKGKNDAVYYECDNPELKTYITSKGFATDFGSYSDISTVAPELGVAAVNLSSGYYNAHTLHEYINRRHLNDTVAKVQEIVAEAANPDFPKYEYIEDERWAGYGMGWGMRYLYDRDPWQSSYKKKTKTVTTKTVTTESKTIISEKNFDIDSIPSEIRDDYEALLDFYTVSELEQYRMEMGDAVIPMLAESEFGYSYTNDGRMYDEVEDEDLYGGGRSK